jgi:hypothetical protein
MYHHNTCPHACTTFLHYEALLGQHTWTCLCCRKQAVAKLYLALAGGNVTGLRQPRHIDAPIGEHPKELVARMVCPHGQAASTTALAVSWNDHVDLAALGGTAGEVPVHDSVTAHGAHMSGWRSIHQGMGYTFALQREDGRAVWWQVGQVHEQQPGSQAFCRCLPLPHLQLP